MHDRTIQVFTHGLTAFEAILAKTEAHVAAHKLDPASLLTFRLYPDMLPFTRQVQIATDHARRCPARLLGIDPLSMPDTETTFPELRSRVTATVDHLASFAPARLAGTETAEVVLKMGPTEMRMTGSDYVGRYALPNFYFHLTTAYAILRHNGVVLGKRDFLGG